MTTKPELKAKPTESLREREGMSLKSVSLAYQETVCLDCSWNVHEKPLDELFVAAKRHASRHIGHRVRVRIVTMQQFWREQDAEQSGVP